MNTTQYKQFIPPYPRFYVYVAGPISKGVWEENMQMAAKAFNMLVYAGMVPFVPQATSLLNNTYISEGITVSPNDDYQFWLEYDFAYIRDVCDALLLLPGESWGGEREVEFVNSLGKPIFDNISDLFDYAESLGFELNRKAATIFEKEYDNAIYNAVS